MRGPTGYSPGALLQATKDPLPAITGSYGGQPYSGSYQAGDDGENKPSGYFLFGLSSPAFHLRIQDDHRYSQVILGGY